MRRGPFWLGGEPVFPPPYLADENGLLALGGSLSPKRLMAAYSAGVFPWPLGDDQTPMLWFSPDPRFVLYPDELHVSRSLRRTLASGRFESRVDTAFREVIEGCARAPGRGRDGTWLSDEMIDAYVRLHELGFAHSFESWDDGGLAGGVYGVGIGRAFFAESMYFARPAASKVALVALVRSLGARGYRFIDCQQETENLARFGARMVPRPRFLAELSRALELPEDMPLPGSLLVPTV